MKSIKIVLETPYGWHIRNPATYRVERTYPVIPPTILFGIIQNILCTSSRRTKYRNMISLGGFPTSDIGLSLDMERIAKLYTRMDSKSKKYKHVVDRHQIEIAHSEKMESFIIFNDDAVFVECLEMLEKKVGEIVLLTTNQFPAIVKEVTSHDPLFIQTNKVIFCMEREGWGLPHVLPLNYNFKRFGDYRAQEYHRVILPFSPFITDKRIKKSEITLKNEIKALKIDDYAFDLELIKFCENKWEDNTIKMKIGTI
jgi:CRISPR-associated Cas5-like protein